MNYTVALTGATGFIGNRVARQLVANGCKLKALTRATSDRSRLAGLNIHWVEGALEDLGSLRRLVRGADAVIHCAGAVRGATQVQFDRSNIDGVARLVQAAIEQQPLPRFLLLSSLAARLPDLSPYAQSKRQGETVLAANAGQMPWAVLRPPSVYGPGEKEMMPLLRWMTRGIAIILGSGKGRFSLLYADDLAEAIHKLLLADDLPKKVFEPHDGHPDGYLWKDVIDAVGQLSGKRVLCLHLPVTGLKIVAKLNLILARLLGYEPLFTPGKLSLLLHPDWVSDDNALTLETGWAPRVSLEEGLRRTLEL